MLRKQLPYIIGFVLLILFCGWEFGPVLRHLAEENYFCFEALPLTFVLRQPLGGLFWVGRFLMLPFQWQWIGGIYLAILLTISAWLIDRALGLSSAWKGVGFLAPTAVMGFAAYRGYNLFMRNEPSQLILWVWGLLLASVLAALVMCFLRRNGQKATEKTYSRPWGLLTAVVAIAGLAAGTYIYRQNVIIACDMQNMMLEEDWEGMKERADEARNPDRSVAAYHVIAITQMGQVLEHAFDLDYDYQKVNLDSVGGMDEGVNYIAECNLHAGLVQPAYHYAMEQMVMSGPRLRYFKIMAIASLLNDEKALCERYLHIIGLMPGQGDFVERVKYKLEHREELATEPTTARILSLAPLEDKFEQNFRTPAFLGYSVGVLSGTDETLNISVAAALYSKDMENIILRASYLQQKRTLPLCVQQALVIASFKRPGLLDRFPGIDKFVVGQVQSFAQQAVSLAEDKSDEGKELMRKTLKPDWCGTYMYYYYCGNLNQTAQRKTETAVN